MKFADVWIILMLITLSEELTKRFGMIRGMVYVYALVATCFVIIQLIKILLAFMNGFLNTAKTTLSTSENKETK